MTCPHERHPTVEGGFGSVGLYIRTNAGQTRAWTSARRRDWLFCTSFWSHFYPRSRQQMQGPPVLHGGATKSDVESTAPHRMKVREMQTREIRLRVTIAASVWADKGGHCIYSWRMAVVA